MKWLKRVISYRSDISRSESGEGAGGDASPSTPNYGLFTILPDEDKGKKQRVRKKKQRDIGRRPGEPQSSEMRQLR